MIKTRQYDLVPRQTQRIETGLRRIVTPLPVPESIPLLEKLYRYEPVAMRGLPPVVWDRAERFTVQDPYGNQWIDWSSGVLITNAGHGRKEIVDAIVAMAQRPLLTNYCFPNEIRAQFVERLVELLPSPIDKVFLLTTGSETVEGAIKICRTYGSRKFGPKKVTIVSFDKAFHGRTLGSQQAGGLPALKEWIINLDPGFVQVPFPDGFRTEDTSFDGFLRALADEGVDPAEVAGVMLETYQGGSASFAPVPYIQELRRWCDEQNALLVFDEVQAAFGRCGTLWGFEHYETLPDLVCFGKGISSSLPLSAIAGRAELMDLHAPGSMTSTHTGNPVCCAAALASMNLVVDEDLPGNAKRLGEKLQGRLREMKKEHPQIGWVDGRGLVAGIACVVPGTKEPDAALAWETVRQCVERGVLMFSPVGFGGATIKINPPLCITEEALAEGLEVLQEAFVYALKEVEVMA